MTLTAEESSNKEWMESETDENLIKMIRVAMEEGCIRPCHIYDAVDEVLCRLADRGKQPETNAGLDSRNAGGVEASCNANTKKVIAEMRQKADSIIAGIDDLTTNHLGMAMRAERRWQAKDLRMFADKLEKGE